MPEIPLPSPSRRPLPYTEGPCWPDFTTTLENAKLPIPMINQHKKRVESIAAIADQIRWTCSKMKPEYWPDQKSDLAMQFFMSNLLQLRIICYEPIMAIRKHINKDCRELMDMDFGLRDKSYWPTPRQVRQTESPIIEPLPTPEWKQAEDAREKAASETADKDSSKKPGEPSTKPPPETKRSGTEEEKAGNKKAKEAAFFIKEEETRARLQKLNILINQPNSYVEYEKPDMDKDQTWEDALRSTMRTYDAAEMELERHYRLIGYTKHWPKMARLDSLRDKKGFPTRSNQELLLEIAANHELGPPTLQTRTIMANWATGTDVRNSLRVHLGRFLLDSEESRHWTNHFTRGIDHPSAGEPAMFFLCQHEYSEKVTKWIVGATTPLTGADKRTKWKSADEVYKAVREQGMGKDWVGHVKEANDKQRALEKKLLGPTYKPKSDHVLSTRQEVIATLRADPKHQQLVARPTCRGLSIDKTMVPTQCCYRCQCNFQYIVLTNHMTTTDKAATSHLRNYDWVKQCGWDQQCAEASAACQCQHFDEETDQVNKPVSSRLKKMASRKISQRSRAR